MEEAKAFFFLFFYLTALLTLTALAVENRGGLCVRDGTQRPKLKLWLIYLLYQGFHFTVFRKATPVCRWQRRFLFSWVHLKLSGVFKVLTWDHLASVDFFNRVYSCGRSNSSGARTLKYVRKTKEPEMKMLRGITQEKSIKQKLQNCLTCWITIKRCASEPACVWSATSFSLDANSSWRPSLVWGVRALRCPPDRDTSTHHGWTWETSWERGGLLQWLRLACSSTPVFKRSCVANQWGHRHSAAQSMIGPSPRGALHLSLHLSPHRQLLPFHPPILSDLFIPTIHSSHYHLLSLLFYTC